MVAKNRIRVIHVLALIFNVLVVLGLYFMSDAINETRKALLQTQGVATWSLFSGQCANISFFGAYAIVQFVNVCKKMVKTRKYCTLYTVINAGLYFVAFLLAVRGGLGFSMLFPGMPSMIR